MDFFGSQEKPVILISREDKEKHPFCKKITYRTGVLYYFTVTFTVAFFLPERTVIVAVPFFLAVMTPLEFTDATFELEDL